MLKVSGKVCFRSFQVNRFLVVSKIFLCSYLPKEIIQFGLHTLFNWFGSSTNWTINVLPLHPNIFKGVSKVSKKHFLAAIVFSPFPRASVEKPTCKIRLGGYWGDIGDGCDGGGVNPATWPWFIWFMVLVHGLGCFITRWAPTNQLKK